MADHKRAHPSTSSSVYPHLKYQSFLTHPPEAPRVKKYFKLFPYLHEELKLAVLSFVADAPFEIMPENYPKSALTNELPAVSRRFRLICNSDLLWKDAVVRITKQEPGMWKKALQSICGGDAAGARKGETILDLVERAHQTLCVKRPELSSFKSIYEHVVNQHLRFKGPVFLMPGQVALGQTYALHMFEPRYRLMIAEAMLHQSVEARNGGRLTGPPVCFIHANRAPLERSVPAVLVQVVQCQIYADGRADVVLLPVHFVWMERIWIQHDSGDLYYAQCLKMGRGVTSQMNHLQRQEALANVMDRLTGQLNEDDDSPPYTTTDGDDDSDHDSDSEASNDNMNDDFVEEDDEFDSDDSFASTSSEEEHA